MAPNDDLPVSLTPSLFRRLMKLLRWFEAGRGNRPPGQGATAGTADDNPIITITGNATGGGRYNANLLLPIIGDVTEGTNLALAEIGTAATSPAVLALNLPELGKTTHALTAGRVCNARFLRQKADGTLVVTISEYGFFNCVVDS